jgi:hypothetical protein
MRASLDPSICRLRQSQQGQALTEFLGVAAVLVPLVLLVPVIGKLQDLRHATQMAGRTAAFDATVHNDLGAGFKPVDTLAAEVRQRHLGSMDAFIRSGEVASDAGENRRSLWTTPTGQPWITSLADIRVGFGADASADRAAGFSAASDGQVFDLNPFASARSLGLGTRGVFTADVTVPLARLPEGVRAWEPFDRLDLSLRSHTSVLIDGWTARSPEQVESRVAGLAPLTGSLAQAAVNLFGVPIEMLELGRLNAPRIGQLDTWRDVLPADRLTGADRRPVAGSGGSAPGPASPAPSPNPNEMP